MICSIMKRDSAAGKASVAVSVLPGTLLASTTVIAFEFGEQGQAGPLNMTMRLYAHSSKALDGLKSH